jgi:6,7-dimethyl-8-ribityllumazine synthase
LRHCGDGRRVEGGRVQGMKPLEVDGKGLRVTIVRTMWNTTVIDALVEGCVAELKRVGVAEADIKILTVPGAFELPHACKRVVSESTVHAVIAVGCLIKGETMHFEYIAGAVSQELARVRGALRPV